MADLGIGDLGIGVVLGMLSLLLLGLKWELDRPLTWGAALVIPVVAGVVAGAVMPMSGLSRYWLWGGHLGP